MRCWTCKDNAVGTCRFCGRATCEDHTGTRPFVLNVIDDRIPARGLLVEDALHCGRCFVHPDPVELTGLTGTTGLER